MEREYLIKGFSDEDVGKFHQIMVDSAVALKADPERAATEMRGALEFQMELAKVNLIDPQLIANLLLCYPF